MHAQPRSSTPRAPAAPPSRLTFARPLRASAARGAAGLFAAIAVGLAGGCNLISGLSELSISETTTTGTTTSGSGGSGSGGDGSGGTTTGSTTDTEHCANGTVDPDETDQDCGGPVCAPCATTKACQKHTDCLSELCVENRCVAAVGIAAGNAHGCVVLDTGAVRCWGQNGSGQLGSGDQIASSVPLAIPLSDVVEVTAGGLASAKGNAHTCARKTDGTVWCWGANDKGQLGNGNTDDSLAPVQVAALSGAKRVAAGGAFTCAIASNTGESDVACWGANANGQLANGGVSPSSDPLWAADLVDATQLSAGASHACSVLSDGLARCWGNNDREQVGIEPPIGITKPALLAAPSGVTLTVAGADFTCALSPAGFSCWGDNSDAQLTTAVADPFTATPTLLALGPVQRASLGSDGDAAAGNSPSGGHACVVLTSGQVSCWGNNRNGQLGRAKISEKEGLPMVVLGLDPALDVVSGAEFSCAILISGAVRCWGRNDLGQLGNGAPGASHSSPVPLAWP